MLELRFTRVFNNKPGKTSLCEHRIETEGSKPVRLPPYRLPHAYRDQVKKELAEMECNGIIEPACSEWASLLLVVQKKKSGELRLCVDLQKKKKSGELRLCVDYRRLTSYPV